METFDPRGGWNRYKFRVDFFKKWSDEMAYVLGFLYADGDMIDADSSSRSQYIKFSNKDREIIEKIRSVLRAEHPIHSRPPHMVLHKNGFYRSSELFFLRIGSRRMFADLIELGLSPNKSKIMRFPAVPSKYLNHFIRGYFDGDGTIYIESRRNAGKKMSIKRARTSFSSGSESFLKTLSNILAEAINVRRAKIYKGTRDFQIVYSIRESVKIFKFMYKNSRSLLLKRKFDNFKRFFNIRIGWSNKEITKILNESTKYLATYPTS